MFVSKAYERTLFVESAANSPCHGAELGLQSIDVLLVGKDELFKRDNLVLVLWNLEKKYQCPACEKERISL